MRVFIMMCVKRLAAHVHRTLCSIQIYFEKTIKNVLLLQFIIG